MEGSGSLLGAPSSFWPVRPSVRSVLPGHLERPEASQSTDLLREPPSAAKKKRTVFTKEQKEQLETQFQNCKFITGAERATLAARLNLKEDQVKAWFKNRRGKINRQQRGQRLPKSKGRVHSSASNTASVPGSVLASASAAPGLLGATAVGFPASGSTAAFPGAEPTFSNTDQASGDFLFNSRERVRASTMPDSHPPPSSDVNPVTDKAQGPFPALVWPPDPSNLDPLIWPDFLDLLESMEFLDNSCLATLLSAYREEGACAKCD